MSAPGGPELPAASSSAPESDIAQDPDHILLKVLSPSPEVTNNGRITFEKINLDTSISQLKQRIHLYLPTRPGPERQRLIYRGHALLNGEATLRQILRAQQLPSEYSSSYTLHLVLPPTQTSISNAPSNTSIPLPQQQVPATPGVVPGPLPTLNQNLPHDHQDAIAQAHRTQHALQQQLNLLQQQIPSHNVNMGHSQHMPPGSMHMTYQIQGGGQPMQTPFPPGFFPAPANIPYLQNIMAHQQQMRAQAGMHGVHNQNLMVNNQAQPQSTSPPPPNGESSTDIADQGITHYSERVQPDGTRIRSTVRIFESSPGGAPITASGFLSGAEARRDEQFPPDEFSRPPSTDRRTPIIPPPVGPTGISNNTRHLPFPFTAQQRGRSQATSSLQPTAWVLSSPSGPEAIIFAPGHGLFASPSRATSTRLTPTRTHQQQSDAPTTQDTNSPGTNQGLPNAPTAIAAVPNADGSPPAGQVALQQQELRQNPAQNPNRANNEEDMMNFVVHRGWLFLRLYMFILVFSESNTWRRYLLLSLATLVCLLPRRNPFHTAFAVVRRHIDNLVGPPAPRRQEQEQPPNGTTPQVNNGSGATPTPEETATRLLRQHQQQNPNVFRDALFRVERALALFLASLVPGVGERHIRAREEVREEARREVQRIEAETRATEDRRNAEGAVSSTSGPVQEGNAENRTQAIPDSAGDTGAGTKGQEQAADPEESRLELEKQSAAGIGAQSGLEKNTETLSKAES